MKRIILLCLALLLSFHEVHAQSTTPGERSSHAPRRTALTSPQPQSQGGTGSAANGLATTLDFSTGLMFPHWRAAMARVIAGTGNGIIFTIGDSTSLNPSLLSSVPYQLGTLLNTAGLPTNNQSRFASYASADARYSEGSWGQGTPVIGGNNVLFAINSGAGTITFTPTINVDTFVIYSYNGSAGAYSWTIDSGSPTTVNETSSVVGAMASTTLGSHTLSLNWVSGGVNIVFIKAYDSSKSQIFVYNAGASGTHTADWVSTSNGLGGLCYFNQDLTTINLGINDECQDTVSLGTYLANLQILVTKTAACGDVVLVTHHPTNPGASAGGGTCPLNSVQANFMAGVYALAAKNNIPVIDFFNRWVSYSTSNPFGYYNVDGVHELSVGAADEARAMFNVLY